MILKKDLCHELQDYIEWVERDSGVIRYEDGRALITNSWAYANDEFLEQLPTFQIISANLVRPVSVEVLSSKLNFPIVPTMREELGIKGAPIADGSLEKLGYIRVRNTDTTASWIWPQMCVSPILTPSSGGGVIPPISAGNLDANLVGKVLVVSGGPTKETEVLGVMNTLKGVVDAIISYCRRYLRNNYVGYMICTLGPVTTRRGLGLTVIRSGITYHPVRFAAINIPPHLKDLLRVPGRLNEA